MRTAWRVEVDEPDVISPVHRQLCTVYTWETQRVGLSLSTQCCNMHREI